MGFQLCLTSSKRSSNGSSATSKEGSIGHLRARIKYRSGTFQAVHKLAAALLGDAVVGQRGYDGVQDRVLKGIQGVVLGYDVTRDATRESLRTYWIPRMKEADLH